MVNRQQFTADFKREVERIDARGRVGVDLRASP